MDPDRVMEISARFWCAFCGRPADLSAVGFLQGASVPECPCRRDLVTCADCGMTLADDFAWLEHVAKVHPD